MKNTMTDNAPQLDPQLYQLILSLHAGAMQQMGKVASPFTGKVERNLAAARTTIDMVDMLKRKTAGNLSDDEAKLLEHVLYELRMNFVDESKKGDTETTSEDTPKESTENSSPDRTDDSEPNKTD